MAGEREIPYSERTATVVGGRGSLGGRVVSNLEPLRFKDIRICEKEDSFTDFLNSDDFFFAVDDQTVKATLQASRDFLSPGHTILDGCSIKEPLVTLYRELDGLGVSVCSTHLGAVPTHPWRGVKVWICKVGNNSQRAKRLAIDLFLPTNSSIQAIDIEDHKNVERDQFITVGTAQIIARMLKDSDFPLGKFDQYATLNAEQLSLLIGRTLGQGAKIPSELIGEQPRKSEYFSLLKRAVQEFEEASSDPEELERFMLENIDFHDQDGFVGTAFRRAGAVGSRLANLRMYSLSFRITNDRPGVLRELLVPFYEEGADLTGIDSMPGIITEGEEARGVHPDKIVNFDIAIDPKTINLEKERKIKEKLVALGCSISEH